MKRLKYKTTKPSPGVIVITTGDLTVRAVRREHKYDGWTGYSAYVLGPDGDKPRWPTMNAPNFRTLTRRIAKLEGADVEEV